MRKIVCVMEQEYEISEQQKQQISALCEANHYKIKFCLNKDAFEEVKDAEVIYGFDAKLIPYAPELKWFASTWAGVSPYLKEGLLKEDTLLTNASGCFGITIAEHMTASLIMMMRQIPMAQSLLDQGEWKNDFKIDTIYGSTALLIGTGDLGTCFAERLKAFGANKIIGINRSGIKKNEVYDEAHPVTELDQYLGSANIIAMTLPETAETRNLLTRGRIALIRQDAYLINTGRGTSIDEDALAEALNAHRLKGAALDVFRTEPLPPDAPIRHAENVFLTPHMAGQMGAEVTRDLHIQMFTKNLKKYFNREPLDHLVDRAKGY